MKNIKMKKQNIASWGVVLFVLLGIFSAQVTYAEEDHGGSVEENIEQILVTQGIENEKDIACDDVSKENLERLGDAVMGRMIGNDALHTQMDRMMGGEGSETLNAMHTHLARTYLGCNDSGFGMGMMMGGGMMQSMMGGGPTGMMGGGMFGTQGFGADQRLGFNNDKTNNTMMGINTMGAGFGGLGGFGMIAFWVLVFFGIVLIIQKIMSKGNTDARDSNRHTNNSALDILKERYSRGEIDQKEFEQKKKDIL